MSAQSYSFVRGTMEVTSSRIPEANASIPFLVGVTAQWGYDQLHQGLQQSFAAASSSEDSEARFAVSYEQTLVVVPGGAMIPLPALDTSRRVETSVTRVPKAPGRGPKPTK